MKKHLPLIVLALVVLAALLFWFLNPAPAASPTNGPLPEATSTPIQEEGALEEPHAPSSGGGVNIIKQTTLQVFSHESWDIELRSVPEWNMSVEADGEEVTLVTFNGAEANIFVSKDMPIGKPAGLSFETSTRTIAGQEVEVREYPKPNEKYAYYLYFTLSVGNDSYYFSIRSYVASKEATDEFINRISIK